MKESELKIDWKKHVCYSKQAKKVIRKRLAEQFDAAETEKRWEDVQLKYVEYLETLPYLGERKTDIMVRVEPTIVLRFWRTMKSWTESRILRKSMS